MAYTIDCAKCSDQSTACCGAGDKSIIFDGLILSPDGGGSPELFERPFQVSFGVSSFRLVDRRGFERNYTYAEINGLTTEEIKTLISECKCPPRGNEHIEITDSDLTVPGSPTVADIEAFALANGHTDVHIYYVGGGTDGDPDYTWHVDIASHVIRTEYPQGGVGGAGIVRYKTGDAWVEATGYGVTYSTGNGSITFVVPAGVLLLQAFTWGGPTNLNSDGDLIVIFNDSASSGGYNINDTDIFPPIVQKVNMNAKALGGLSVAPYNYDIDFDPTPSIISSAAGVLTMKIENLSGISQWGLTFGF